MLIGLSGVIVQHSVLDTHTHTHTFFRVFLSTIRIWFDLTLCCLNHKDIFNISFKSQVTSLCYDKNIRVPNFLNYTSQLINIPYYNNHIVHVLVYTYLSYQFLSLALVRIYSTLVTRGNCFLFLHT